MSVWSDLLEQQRSYALDDLLSRWHHWQMEQGKSTARGHAGRSTVVLSRWHHWQMEQGKSTARGHAGRSTVVGDYIASRQYDDENGALYDDEEQVVMRAVQAHVDNMAEPYRSAAYVMARSLCLGTSAFTSPRLPAFPAERDRVLAHARKWLILRLVSGGLIE